MNRHKRLRGFTLVELLVVISIIALLLSIMMPALNLARRQAKKVICLTNLKQWALAFSMYTLENNDSYPDNCYSCGYGAGKWTIDLWPYLEEQGVYACPEARVPGKTGPYQCYSFGGDWDDNYAGYISTAHQGRSATSDQAIY